MAESKIQVTTDSGFTCEIAEDAFNDMRILDALVELQTGTFGEKMIALKTVLDRFMGTEQKEKLYGHLEELNGKARMELVEKELIEIFGKLGESKKK